MAYLTSADLFAAATGQTVDFDVPGIGTVKLRSLTVLEFSDITRGDKDKPRMMAMTVSAGMVEPSLSYDELMGLRAGAIRIYDTIAQRILELSALADSESLGNFPGGGS